MKKPMMKKGMAYKMGYTKKEMMKGEDTLQTMKKGPIYKYDNSPKSLSIRIAADEKDKVGASESGKKRLNRDINVMINKEPVAQKYGTPMRKMGCSISKHMKSK
jgi:hypothetical protein